MLLWIICQYVWSVNFPTVAVLQLAQSATVLASHFPFSSTSFHGLQSRRCPPQVIVESTSSSLELAVRRPPSVDCQDLNSQDPQALRDIQDRGGTPSSRSKFQLARHVPILPAVSNYCCYRYLDPRLSSSPSGVSPSGKDVNLKTFSSSPKPLKTLVGYPESPSLNSQDLKTVFDIFKLPTLKWLEFGPQSLKLAQAVKPRRHRISKPLKASNRSQLKPQVNALGLSRRQVHQASLMTSFGHRQPHQVRKSWERPTRSSPQY
ncbi:hypothetical protein C8R46DRAFT_1029032 [Mycena filopes]|nr:hypothetical protein C8R46DRAFT_1029032 [Mycena filopes]